MPWRRRDIRLQNWDAVTTDDAPGSTESDINTANRAGKTRLRVEGGGTDCALTERCDSKPERARTGRTHRPPAIVSGPHTLYENSAALARDHRPRTTDHG